MKSIVISSSLTLRSFVLDRYLQDIAKYGLLSTEDEVKLGIQIALGDQESVDKLVRCNLRFVVSVAKKYQHQGLTLEDLISEGNLGLMVAAKRFDHTKGFKFISFAVWWIRQSIMHAIQQKQRIVRLPANQTLGVIKVVKAESDLEQVLERKPSLTELSEYTELAVAKVKDFQEQTAWSVSLDKERAAEDGGTLYDVLVDGSFEAPDMGMMKEGLAARISLLLRRLPNREAEMLKLAFGIDTGIPLELADIAIQYNLSKERVRQLIRNALVTLRRLASPDLLGEIR